MNITFQTRQYKKLKFYCLVWKVILRDCWCKIMEIWVKTTFQGFFHWCIEPLICRALGKASVPWTSTTHGWSREPLMCSTLMFGTLKLGLIDLQSAPHWDPTFEKSLQSSFSLPLYTRTFLQHPLPKNALPSSSVINPRILFPFFLSLQFFHPSLINANYLCRRIFGTSLLTLFGVSLVFYEGGEGR